MSDKSSIFVRYNVTDEKSNEVNKGIIGNHYRGFDPFGMISRAVCGMEYFRTNAGRLRYIICPIEKSDVFQVFRRMFDVDFIRFGMDVSCDATAHSKKDCTLEDIEQNRKEIKDKFFWCDTDFGQLLIDITGTSDDVKIKYAYIDNVFEVGAIKDVNDYKNKYIGCFEENDKEGMVQELLQRFESMAELMTQEEIEEYISESVVEYLYYNEIKEAEHEKERRQRLEQKKIDSEDILIEDLELSLRASNCLRRAGIDTVGQLRAFSKEEVESIRNLNKKALEEVLEIWR